MFPHLSAQIAQEFCDAGNMPGFITASSTWEDVCQKAYNHMRVVKLAWEREAALNPAWREAKREKCKRYASSEHGLAHRRAYEKQQRLTNPAWRDKRIADQKRYYDANRDQELARRRAAYKAQRAAMSGSELEAVREGHRRRHALRKTSGNPAGEVASPLAASNPTSRSVAPQEAGAFHENKT